MNDGYTRLHPVDVIAETNEMLVTGSVDIFENVEVPEAKGQPKKKKVKAKKVNQLPKKSATTDATIKLDTQITIDNETLSVEDYILELLPDFADGDSVFTNKLTMKIITTAEIKDARKVKGLSSCVSLRRIN